MLVLFKCPVAHTTFIKVIQKNWIWPSRRMGSEFHRSCWWFGSRFASFHCRICSRSRSLSLLCSGWSWLFSLLCSILCFYLCCFFLLSLLLPVSLSFILLLLFPFSSCSSRMAAHLALVRTLAPDIHFAVEALVFGGAGANCTRYLEIYLSSPPGDDSVDPADLRWGV